MNRPEIADKLVYRMEIGKSGCAWFIPQNVPNPADNLLVTDSENWDIAGEGFGGSTLTLQLNGGETFLLKGGWHSNGHHLLSDTGIDLTDMHYTYGIITERDGTVVYEDEKWEIRDFDFIENKCREMVNKSGIPLRYTNYSWGGSQECTISPKLDNYEKELQ